MSDRDRLMLAILLLVGSFGIGYFLLLPAWDTFQVDSAAVSALSAEVETLTAQEAALSKEIQDYQKLQGAPTDIQVKTYTIGQEELALKEMQNQLIAMIDQTGASLISLEPFDKERAKLAGLPVVADVALPGAPAAAPSSQFRKHPYLMILRGTYGEVADFIKSVAIFDDLIELSNIKLVNEAGDLRKPKQGNEVSGESPGDPSKPIKFACQVTIYLVPGRQ